MVRTLEEIRKMSTISKDNYCCDKQPLLNIPLDHIVVDELHLILHVTDILIENLVYECLDWDREDDLDKKKHEAKGAHLKNLTQVIRSWRDYCSKVSLWQYMKKNVQKKVCFKG